MEARGPERDSAAVLAADMVGYSRLMEADEAGTLARLKAHRLELIDPAIAKNRGRIIKTTGDGMLVEFRSVVDAVQCAVEIQRRMARRNADCRRARRIQFRIGINLGDIIVEGDDIFGDGVNIAARLEELAEPGGICVVRRRARSGRRQARRHRLRGSGRAERQEHHPPDARLPGAARRRTQPERRQRHGRRGDASDDRTSRRSPCCRFANMSGDPEQEFFADGLTEDIITELSRFRDLFVISRNSTFVYKGKAVNVQEVARELGVALCGRRQRAQGRQPRAHHRAADRRRDRPAIWAERYDRELEDIFAIQDEVTAAIVGHAARPRRGGDARTRQAQADRQHGGLRMRARRQGAAPPLAAARTMPRRSG